MIDCRTEDLAAEARFWASALGYPMPEDFDAASGFIQLVTPPGEVQVIIQRVDHNPRAHLDIDSDSVEAEVARLQSLGATVVARHAEWVVMQALRETLTEWRIRARVAFACEQGAVTAVQSFCTREPQRRAHAKAAEPLRGWHPRFPDPALRRLRVEPLPAARRAWSRKTWGTNANAPLSQCLPNGHRFCVGSPYRGGFEQGANTWE
ncbi:VOC family protein [Thioalkalivibrio sp. ALJ4]|uniref:VOC family protein n=4 Tax=unclassified Thioalkalivibrio TaxID=2621013 RepID=UPI001E62FF09|nr:VOC family protein [Thioalkalivibrio sp. ALJ4]